MNAKIDIADVILATPRLTLRAWRESDLADFYEYASEDGVGQMAGWAPHESISKTAEILGKFIIEHKTFAVIYKGHAVGSVGVEKYNEELLPEFAELRGRELGFVLKKELWGQGLMPEAVKEVIRWLFIDNRLDFITCGHFLTNGQSARVQQKCGFVPCKDHLYRTHMGTVEMSRMNVLTRESWRALQEQQKQTV